MTIPLNFHSVRTRLLVAAVCVESLMLGLMVANGLRVLRSGMAEQAQIHANQLVPVLHAALVTPLAQRDYATVQAILDESRSENVLDYLAVTDSRGRVIAISGWPRETPLPAASSRLSLAEGAESRYDVGAQVVLQGQALGAFQFGMNLKQLVAALHTQFIQSVTIAAAAILLSAALLAGIGIWLTRNFSRIIRFSKAVAVGDYAPGELPEGSDDIGRLGMAFNAMSRAVRERVGDLTVAIQRRTEIEAELRDSEARFRDLAGSASDWFWETDAAYRLTFASERIANVLGVKPAAILGISWLDIGLGEKPAIATPHLADIAARQPFRNVEFNIGPPGGKDFRTVRISGIPVFDKDGSFEGYRGVGVDITREIQAERRAQRAQQQLVDAIESLVDAIAVYDADDRLVICNTSYKHSLAISDELLAARPSFSRILHNAYAREVFEIGDQHFERWLIDRQQRHLVANGQIFLVRTRDGHWLQSREFPTREGGVVTVRTDITELKLREEERDTLRRRYELILSSAGEGIVGLDKRGCLTFANRMAATMLGRDIDDMIGVCLCEFLGSQDEGDAASSIMAACLGGKSDVGRGQMFRLAGGAELAVDYFVSPMVENDEVTGAVLLFRDATLRLQYEWALANQQAELARQVAERTAELRREVEVRARTEAALRASRERMKGITDSLVEGVVVVDRVGRIVFANPSAKRLLEWGGADEIEGNSLDTLVQLRRPGGALSLVEGSGDGAVPSDEDAVFMLASGRTLPVAFARAPLADDDIGRGTIISFRDISVLKHAQREALQTSRLASIGQLAAGIAHEINTPIQYIGDNLRYVETALPKLGQGIAAARMLSGRAATTPELAAAAAEFDEALVRSKLDRIIAELPGAVQESLDGIGQIARIVLSMKEFSHPGTTAKTSTDINRAIESTLTVSRNGWKHVAKVERDFDPALPPVLCHAGEMNQVFLNLVINAAHAIEASGKPQPGRIAVTTRRDGEWVEIRVADNGTGVPLAIRDRIFDPFFTTKAVGKGTGQGLAICRDVVTVKHGGSIDVAGTEGEGAVFIVRLPIDGGGETTSEEPA